MYSPIKNTIDAYLTDGGKVATRLPVLPVDTEITELKSYMPQYDPAIAAPVEGNKINWPLIGGVAVVLWLLIRKKRT